MSSLSRRGWLTIWCWLALQLWLHSSNAADPTLTVVENSSEYHQPVVSLRCQGSGASDAVTFFNKVGNITREVRTDENEPRTENSLSFQLNQTNEGIYICQINGADSNEELLVAYPFPDPSISREYTVELGARLIVNCTIPAGILRDKYSIVWFKGDREIDFMSSEHVTRDDFALVFHTIMASDNSRGYNCVVNVTRKSENITRQGSTIAVNVVAPLTMTGGVLTGVSVAVGNDAVFSCHATGVPAPEFRWLLNGTEYLNGVITGDTDVRETSIYVESTLRLSRVIEAQTGSVTCMAFHYNSGEIVTVSSTTNLVVLTNDFTVQLTARDSQIRMNGTLPVSITGFFFIRVRFHSDGMRNESLISDSSFKDTNIVNFIIANEKLPNFQDFFVTVAIESDGVTGPYTTPSNRIESPKVSDVSACEHRDSNIVVVVVLSVIIVIMIVVIGILIMMCALIYYKRMIYKASSEYSCSPKSSLRRSVSCSSYRSQSSHHSHYSSKSISSRGSESSDSHSVYSDSPDIKISSVTDQIEEEQQERDVRNYETIDHRVLKQTEEKKIRYLDQPINQFHLGGARVGGSCDDMAASGKQMELQPVFPNTHTAAPTHTIEPPQHIFPNTHTGATNRLAVYNTNRDSNSSFEDLEDDCHLEFSTTVPRRY